MKSYSMRASEATNREEFAKVIGEAIEHHVNLIKKNIGTVPYEDLPFFIMCMDIVREQMKTQCKDAHEFAEKLKKSVVMIDFRIPGGMGNGEKGTK